MLPKLFSGVIECLIIMVELLAKMARTVMRVLCLNPAGIYERKHELHFEALSFMKNIEVDL